MEFIKVTELKPLNTKSFYGKAKILESNTGIYKLLSYDTEVASYNRVTNKMNVYGWYSLTTSRHINAFLEYFGFDKCNKKQMESYND